MLAHFVSQSMACWEGSVAEDRVTYAQGGPCTLQAGAREWRARGAGGGRPGLPCRALLCVESVSIRSLPCVCVYMHVYKRVRGSTVVPLGSLKSQTHRETVYLKAKALPIRPRRPPPSHGLRPGSRRAPRSPSSRSS